MAAAFETTVPAGTCSRTPLIGVLCVDSAKSLLDALPDQPHHSYIAASYVKCLEAAGALVVPIW